MACSRMAARHFLSQYLPTSISRFGVNRPQWVNWHQSHLLPRFDENYGFQLSSAWFSCWIYRNYPGVSFYAKFISNSDLKKASLNIREIIRNVEISENGVQTPSHTRLGRTFEVKIKNHVAFFPLHTHNTIKYCHNMRHEFFQCAALSVYHTVFGWRPHRTAMLDEVTQPIHRWIAVDRFVNFILVAMLKSSPAGGNLTGKQFSPHGIIPAGKYFAKFSS